MKSTFSIGISGVMATVGLLVVSVALTDEKPALKAKPAEDTPAAEKPLVGIGAALKPVENGFEVMVLVPNGSAALSGQVNEHDVIIAVGQGNDKPVEVKGMKLERVVELI